MTSPNEQTILANLEGTEGLSADAAYGVLGNFQVESSFNPAAYNPAEGAIGIAQWEGGRRSNLDQLAGAMGLPETSLTAQLAYLNQELAGPFSGVLAQLKQPGISVQQAADVFDTQYEISSSASLPMREQDAAALAGGGNVNTGTATPTGNLLSAKTGVGSSIVGTIASALGFTSITSTVTAWAAKFAFVGGGIVLVILGANKASSSGRQQAAQLAPIAAAAA